jgi:uncharacterized protein with gpF-like domain
MSNLDPSLPNEAIEFLASKKLKPTEHWTEVWREEHVTSFTVARSAGYDILKDIQDALVENLKTGQTFRHFQKQLIPILQAKGWWGESTDSVTGNVVELGSPRRLKIIYDANIRTARAAAQWQRIQERVQSHPFLLYQLGPSLEHRAEHEGWAGMIVHANDPFWETHFPPNGWGCKCYVRQINNREAQRLLAALVGSSYADYRSTSPKITYRDWKNTRTGQTIKVPLGIDPGWDTNPGFVRWGAAVKVMTEKAKTMDAPQEVLDIKPQSTLSELLGWVKKVLKIFTERGLNGSY